MGITIEKIEGKEGLQHLIEMLANGGLDHMNKMHEAKVKLKAAGFGKEAMAACFDFAIHVDELASVTATAVVIAETLRSHEAIEFSLAALAWIERGLNNSHDMFEKADVDPNVFNLRKRDPDTIQFIRERASKVRKVALESIEYVAKDTLGHSMRLSGATEGEAAIDALSKFGYTLFVNHK